jgi:predicted amidophosphoribosyltransferase
MLGGMLFSSHCAGCDRPGPVLCRTCRFSLAVPSSLPPSRDVIAAVPFVGRPRSVLLGFKYGNRRQLAHHLAGLLVNRLVAEGVGPGAVDVVTWAPTSAGRRRRRGFDQAELIARRVAAQLGLPCKRLLERDGASPAQTGLHRVARLHGPVFRGSPASAAKRVLVIDDVVTTGSTLRSAETALRQSGARLVRRAAVATTPALVTSAGQPAPTHRRAAPSRMVVQGSRAA